MVGNSGGMEKGPVHARGRSSRASEERLSQLATRLPPPTDDDLDIIKGLRAERRRRHLIAWGVTLLVVALCAGAIAQWVRPLPQATVHATTIRLPGTPPALAWPSTGEAAVDVDGVGALGQLRGTQSVPIAGLADVLTAYVVLSDHPLAPGADGPAIPVTADTISAYQSGLASGDSEVPVEAGETLTQLQALEGLLVNSGSDMATLLADWDAGSVSKFEFKMNATAVKLGLTSTHITDPSGVDPGTTSSAEDLAKLGGVAMLFYPVFQQIVSLGQASVPIPGTTNTVYNLNFDLGQDGIIGIKTGSDSSAEGCYLFAAQQSIGGKPVTVVGAVLGQPGGSLGPNTAAVDAGDALVKSAFASLHSYTVFSPGQKAGQVDAPWGATAPVTVSQPVTVIGWPGITISVSTRHHTLKAPIPSGATVGTLVTDAGSTSVQVPLRTMSPLGSPGVWWRLTR